MKRLMLLLSVALAIIYVAPSALAADWVTTVSDGLKHSSVYVAPGTEGTDSNTATSFEQDVLFGNDNIVLVMLPASAKAEVGDLTSFAKQLSSAIGTQHIIGLSVGTQTLGYASQMPPGTAENAMLNATTAASNPKDALTVFVQNIHTWQREHPEAKTTAKPSSPKSGGVPWFLWLLLVIIVIGASVAIALAATARRSRSGTQHKRFKAADQINGQLSEVTALAAQVNDVAFRRTLDQCCTDIERYFQSYTSDKTGDAQTFRNHLNSVLSVLRKYIEVQNSPRYYNSPDEKMRQGKQSVTDFADYVLKSIRRGNDAGLLDYKVDTDILQAKRYA